MDAFESLQFESEVYSKLQEAEREADLTTQRYSSKEVLQAMREAIGGIDRGNPVNSKQKILYKRK